ncbi:hypothetical protein GUJ93_ZPchr0006g44311 [Zizania palustris]|uniref:Uncharacterized protein n=1 Tax=Zizania palustris TaxID=103762 RepID=A0A8J5SV30_ZIZPA|nr:hypothetical protein GUJ93_ZPchr0006g44311 [Zizania palustris]
MPPRPSSLCLLFFFLARYAGRALRLSTTCCSRAPMASSSAAGASKKKKLMISDYLRDSDGAAVSPPPRLRVPSFTCARIGFLRLGRIKARCGGRKELNAEKSEAASTVEDSSGREAASSGSGSGSGASSSSTEAGAAGLGISLLFLLARTSVELTKMAEVRAQMEALLREMRDEADRCKSAVVAHRRDLLASSSPTASDYSTDTVGAGRVASSPAMETVSGESNKPLEEEEYGGEWSDSDDEFIELASGCLTRGHDDDGGGGGGGLSCMELERRLHELQHERDRERVAELEAALRRSEWRRVEKEMEARLWKDTAELSLQRPLAGRQ